MVNGNNGNGNQSVWRFILQGVGTMVLGGSVIAIGNSWLNVLDHKYRIAALEGKPTPPPEFRQDVEHLEEDVEEMQKDHKEIRRKQENLQEQINELQREHFGGRR